MAYSAGFTPHPKISYAGAAPTGTASEAEYLEISVVQRCEPVAIKAALNEALPPGLDVVDVVEVRAKGALADRLTGSVWEIVLPGVTEADAAAGVDRLLAMERAIVERTTKNGRRELDVRAAVVALRGVDPNEPVHSDLARTARSGNQTCAILQLVVRHSTPTVRPDDVLTALRTVAGLALAAAPQATRLAQGPLDEEAQNVADPLAEDRDFAGA